MLTTNPEHNKPVEVICAKCGRRFVKGPWTSAYSANISYKYADPQDCGLVTLCEDCAKKELDADNVGLIMY